MVVKVTISLPDELADFADCMAEEAHVSRSRLIADLLDAHRRELRRLLLIEGYKEMATENRSFAKEAAPLGAEIWDEWEAT